MDRENTINVFAEEYAKIQKKADKYYYINNNTTMSSFILDEAIVIRDLAIKLGIWVDVYAKALKIYDFRNSGKKGYILKDNKIVKEG